MSVAATSASAMSGAPALCPHVVDDDQLAARPGVVQTPNDAEQVAGVEAALDKGARNAFEQGRVPQDDTLLMRLLMRLIAPLPTLLAEEVAVAPVVRHGAREAHAEHRILVARDGTRRCGGHGRLPVGPRARRPRPHLRIRRLDQPTGRGGEVPHPLGLRHLGDEPLEGLREELPERHPGNVTSTRSSGRFNFR
ncbi:hypothetical protein AQJ67_14455 [Streptomyces caeruleatus]|uniref:Uncharacterized protein n=1 Tax=Streptomyces caeruleatus TaxID=661399 RepID=A0A124I9X8_9ACTN|nr:hypothetical protein AQJ67_14455 [Streptomyces caeruleatus]